jgi:hypothetical protein
MILLRSSDNGSPTMLVLLDLSAAFDSIDHSILIDRLKNYIGLSDSAVLLIKSYLRRQQSVSVNSIMSDPAQLTTGVPQGSVLGPLFFTMYILPLKDFLSRSGINYHVYADDTQLYMTIDPKNIAQNVTKL